ncbi:MAG TPA: S-adenosylmethionine:tRNA ribosyltransferase-isomerase, partial [Myxococcaceae bacterium]|nr:S-adenosylmethionine:tRNA ribosyltransferase-isomerase [Myxococcaceae bacterium]
MPLSDYDFELPRALIAAAPLAERDASRLLALDRVSGAFAHRQFRDWPALLRPGDLVVLNDTRVIPARLLGRKQGSGGRVELLLVRPDGDVSASGALSGAADAVTWICLGQASKGLKPQTVIELEEGRARVVEALGEGELRVRFEAASSVGALLERAGRVPLPPYVDREPTAEDRTRYQTVYAREDGSVAAPTAGLHFTPQLLERLEEVGISRHFVTLHVGAGTFLPVKAEDTAEHHMHAEWGEVSG